MNNQRIYDAMLIKAFRKDIEMWRLEQWLKPYGIKLSDCGLMRIPKFIVWKGRVQTMVGKHLKPLADRLWDTDKSKDIETLDWMKNLDCQNTSARIESDRTRLINNSNNARRKTYIIAKVFASNNRNEQWNVTK